MFWQRVVLCKWYAAKGAPYYACRVVCSLRLLKMILGSKHVGAILNVLI